MRIDIEPTLVMARRDTLMVASDGLSDNLLSDELIEYIRAGHLGDAANKLVVDCRHRMNHPGGDHPSKADDLTFLLYRPAG
jgi:serine/threonine protein phosphatase PrpC